MVFYSLGDGRDGGVYCDAHPIEQMGNHLTMLAYDMNDLPLSFGHGAPLRLHNEVQLGFKQVKWVKGVEFVADFSDIGGGYGGYNQDHECFGYRQSICPERKPMSNTSLTALAREQLELAKAATSGRSAHTVFGGRQHALRQTMIALSAGRKLDEHANPGNATVHVLHGRVRLDSGDNSWEGASGHLIEVPDAPHSLLAIEDSVVLLTVVARA